MAPDLADDKSGSLQLVVACAGIRVPVCWNQLPDGFCSRVERHGMPQIERVAPEHAQLGGANVSFESNSTERFFVEVRDDRDGHNVEIERDSQHSVPSLMDRSAMDFGRGPTF